MEKTQHAGEFGRFRNRISAAVLAVAGIKTESDAGMGSHVKEALTLRRGLNECRDMRMEHQVQAKLRGNLSRLFHHSGNIFPLRRGKRGTPIGGHTSRNT